MEIIALQETHQGNDKKKIERLLLTSGGDK